jgi:precorrin-2 dehydrogenase / sirohydrochlorin ferrochelatase
MVEWPSAINLFAMRYPLFLDLQCQPVVVVGAGKVASRKIRSLLAAGASVTVIAPVGATFLSRFSPAGRGRNAAPTKSLRWLRRPYRRGDLRGAVLVVAATDDFAVNRQVCAEAKRRRQLVNCITEPAAGNFIVPAVARRRGLTVAISTGGTAPALAKRVRRELEQFLDRRYPARRKAAPND